MRQTNFKTYFSPDGVSSGAHYSVCEKYRYYLERKWMPELGNRPRRLIFIMLNPSTATEKMNDPTVARCEERARRNGYNCLTIMNLFAYRATQPHNMLQAADPVGPENDHYIEIALKAAALMPRDNHIICGWGVHGAHRDRDLAVLKMFEREGVKPKALRVSKDGHPWHPLYLSYELQPSEFSGRAG